MRLIYRALVFTALVIALLIFLVSQESRVGRLTGLGSSATGASWKARVAQSVSGAGRKKNQDGHQDNGHALVAPGVDEEVSWHSDDQVVFKDSRFNFVDPYEVEKLDDGESHGRPYEAWAWEPCEPDSPPTAWCRKEYGGLINDIQIVIKTSSLDDPIRFQKQLNTTLAKLPRDNIVLISDKKDTLAGMEMVDIFQTFSKAEREALPEYELYKHIQTGNLTAQRSRYHALDKYKNVPMKKYVWEKQKEKPKKWFLFIETDTYVNWQNLLFWLNHFDSNKDLYFGNIVYSDGGDYANSTAGYILSHRAMEKFHEDEFINDGWYQYPSQHGFNTSSQDRGEVPVAQILRQKETYIRGFSPMFNDKSPFIFGFNEASWCDAVLTLHGGSPDEMQRTHDFIEWWKADTGNMRPLLYKDLFGIIAEELPLTRESWQAFVPDDKLVADWHANNFDHIDQCRQYCQSHRRCMQFALYNGTCAYSYEISMGHETSEDIVSGWKVGRLRSWAKNHQCKNAHWAHQFPPWLGDQGYKVEYDVQPSA